MAAGCSTTRSCPASPPSGARSRSHSDSIPHSSASRSCARFDAAVNAALARERGWRPASPTDLESLLAAGRVKQGRSRYSVTEQYYLLHVGRRRRPIGLLESATLELEPERAET